jgi:hypothetical protein
MVSSSLVDHGLLTPEFDLSVRQCVTNNFEEASCPYENTGTAGFKLDWVLFRRAAIIMHRGQNAIFENRRRAPFDSYGLRRCHFDYRDANWGAFMPAASQLTTCLHFNTTLWATAPVLGCHERQSGAASSGLI